MNVGRSRLQNTRLLPQALSSYLIEYVASSATGHSTEGALARKDKQTLSILFCCLRYRPSKVYFMYAFKHDDVICGLKGWR
ncbi:hypothetical protein BGY98DRAFT_620497 [Russula aff. rugulosa BPL654]|nr:hypothetical protein BGY98DRAFT_620497 [Russula aff. rugulosa BPL654]